MKKWWVLVLLFVALSGAAQTTSVTATITDSDNQTWNNGTFVATFVGIPGVANYQWNGGVLDNAHQTFTGSMNGSGTLSIAALPSNASISPSGTQWRFTLCSNTSAPCSSVTTAVNGASSDLSTTLSNGVTAPRISASYGAHAYSDTEMLTPPQTGMTYYNVTTSQTNVWNGSAWVPITGGTISGTLNYIAKFTSSTNVGNSSAFDDGTNYTRFSLGVNSGTQGYGDEPASNANPGTTLNSFVCINSSQQAFTCGTSNTTGVAGVAVSGAGNSGTPVVCFTQCAVKFDNQTTIGHIAIVSTTVAGEAHDTGSSAQVSGVDSFVVDSVNSGAGTTAIVDILTPRNFSYQNNSLGGKTSILINNNPTQPKVNLNDSTPPVQSGYQLCKWQSSDSGNTTSGSVECPVVHLLETGFGGLSTTTANFGFFVASMTFPANFGAVVSGLTSTAKCGTNPGATITWTLSDVTTSTTIGTIAITSGGVVTLATSGGTSKTVTANDYWTLTPSATDGTAVGCAFVLRGN